MTRLSPRAGLLLTLVNASLLALLVGYSRNTLEQHPQLVLAKQLYTYPPVGTFECLSSRQLLASDRLNFSAWHGFQQVHIGPIEGPLQVELEFRLQPQAYLLLTTSHTPRLQQGIRLSLHSGLPSLQYRATPQGEFLQVEPLDIDPLPAGRWISLGLQGRSLHLQGKTLELWGSPPGPRLLTLGGGQRRCEVRNLRLQGERLPLHNPVSWWLCWLFVMLLLRWPRMQLVLTSLLLSAYLFDRVYWSHRYAPSGLGSAVEQIRLRLAHGLALLNPTPPPHLGVAEFLQLGPQRVRPFIPLHYNRQSSKSLMLVGSSQLWGSGARLPQEMLAAQLARRLPQWHIINASLWGLKARDMRLRLERLGLCAPRVVLVLGNNDGGNPHFEEDVEQLLASLQGSSLLLVAEPNCGELPLRAGVARNHEILSRLARQHRLPVLQLDEALRERLDQGFLWVDRVHLSSFGQQCAAELLARELLSGASSPPPPSGR